MKVNRLLILTDWFYPGFKGGGPIRSTVNLALALQNEFEVGMITTDTDFGETMTYKQVASNTWTNSFSEKADVFYFSHDDLSYSNLLKCIQSKNPDVIYLNSMFSLQFTIWPLVMKLRKQFSGKIVLAPRGMLHEGALRFKKIKKKIFLALMKIAGVGKLVHFHATDEQEAKDIKKVFPKAMVTVIANLPEQKQPAFGSVPKQPATAKFVFISRVHPKKNLLFFLKCLSEIKGKAELSIYGAVEDETYLAECKNLVAGLSAGVHVEWKGPVENDKVVAVLQNHHCFVLPTLGENFGHAIFESFLAGRPVLISDKTPWRNLSAKNVGWDISLGEKDDWLRAITDLMAMDQAEFDALSLGAWKYAETYLKKSKEIERYGRIFQGETLDI